MLRHLNDTKEDFQFAAEVRLQVGPLTEIPFCQGVLQPIIHFPESWRRWDNERIKICLGHELAHIIRRDLLTLLTGQFTCILCWFNPLVWFAMARLRSEAERSADDLLLSRNVAPAIYAANLVAITEDCQAAPLLALSVAFAMARPHRLRTRIDAILDPELSRRSPSRATILVVSFLAVGALIAAMTFRLTAAPAVNVAASQNQDLATIDPQTRDRLWTMASDPIQHDDIQAVASLLARGLNVNVDLADNCSLLFVAVDDHQLDIVKFLLSKGSDVNQKTSWGDTPLRRACWRGYQEIADTLIRAGAAVDPLLYATGMGDVAGLEARDKKQPITAKEVRAAIGFAVASGHENTFDWLWGKVGPLDDQQKDKLLGDWYASAGEWGQLGMLKHLQALGATPAKFGSRALVHAVPANHVDIVKYLLDEGVSPNGMPPLWGNMLRRAAGAGHLEIVRLLLDHGADINARDEQNTTPLSEAAYNGREEVCLLLLARGANGGIEDDRHENAAWQAAGSTHCPKALGLMLKRGVNIAGENKNGMTILSSIMYFQAPRPGWEGFPDKIYSTAEIQDYDQREQQVVDLLIGAGADYNGQTGSMTPLMRAFEAGHLAAARDLLKHGVDLSIHDKDGNTALFYLLQAANREPVPLDILTTLLKHDGNPNIEFHWPGTTPAMTLSALEVAMGDAVSLTPTKDLGSLREAVKMLLDHGTVFAQVTDPNIETLLKAAAEGNLTLVQDTIRQGTSVNSADGKGWDALAISVALGYDKGADWLLANGADASGHYGHTWYSPLRFAVLRGQVDLVNQLLAKGAKPIAAGGTDWISLAVEQKNPRIFDALLKAGADPKDSSSIFSSENGKTYRPPDAFPVFLCIRNGQTAMAKALLDKGANPNPTDLERNRSLVYWAVDYDQPQILQALLDHGAAPAQKADDGESALSLAQKSHPDMVPMLEAAIKRTQKEDSDADERDRAFLLHKVESIIIPHVDFHAVRLSDALETLRQEAARLDAAEPDLKQRGVNIFLKRPAPAKPAAATTPSAAGPTASVSPGSTEVASGTSQGTMADQLITLSMEQRPLLEVLRAVANQVGMKVKPERYAVSLVSSTEQTERLYTAEFRVAPGVFGASVASSPGDAKDHTVPPARTDAKSWLEEKGVTFPVGASATYLPGSQKVIVRNTEENINRLKILFPTLSPTK